MPKKPVNWRLWSKVTVAGLFFGVGGPLFTAWISPSEEEIRAKYNPDLRRRSIEGKAAREAEFDQFVTRLKEYSKSDKPIWVVAKEAEEQQRQDAINAAKAKDKDAEARRQEMRKEAGLDGGVASSSNAEQKKGWFSWMGGK